jgi:hypothetical protein
LKITFTQIEEKKGILIDLKKLKIQKNRKKKILMREKKGNRLKENRAARPFL